MNNLIRTSQTFVNNGTVLPAQGSSISSVTSGVLGVFGSLTNPQTEVSAAPTITTEPQLTLYSGYSDGTTKRGMPIKGSQISKYSGERYSPDTRDVWTLGYSRFAGSGTLAVSNNSVYTFVVGIKYDKELYSERPLDFRITFTSDLTATQQTICAQIYALTIANKQGLNKDVLCQIVGNGTGTSTFVYNGTTYTIYGGSGASLYGVEFWGANIPQFQNTQYRVRRPYFAIFADATTGFGIGTSVAQTNAMTLGNGISDTIYNFENFDYGFEGVLNRTSWPIPVLAYNTVTTFNSSASLTPTVSGTSGNDYITFSAAPPVIGAGWRIGVYNGSTYDMYEVKYMQSTTIAVLTTPLIATYATVAVQIMYQYSTIDLEFNDPVYTSIGVTSIASKQIRIAFPAIDAAGAYNSISAIGTSLKTLFDSYCASSPGSFTPISI